jgi:multidrug efflux pump subunit AcrA (membrane-fusion protein)
MKKALARFFPSGTSLVYLGIAAALVVGSFFYFSRGDDNGPDVLVLQPGEFVREVSVSGKVESAEQVSLAFPDTGRIARISVAVGDRVGRGETLATLAIDVLAADLTVAQADLEEARRQQNAIVESAYRTLLSDDLSPVPNSSTYDATPPVITGIYDGPEGNYRIRVEYDLNSRDYQMRVFDLEDRAAVEVLEDEPTVLGTRGLFITFPDEMAVYRDTIWNIAIPNTKSVSYLANYNAYQEAQRTRDKTITAAEAAVTRARAAINERTLRAPFTGVVTSVDADPGAIVAPNETVISLIGEGTLQIESFVPEINLSLVRPGASAVVTLDAYGSAVPFMAIVASIDPAETVRDGVSTYRAILQFDAQDERIRSGMTANVRIITDRREGVLSVPQGAVVERDGKKYVRIQRGEDIEEREVTTGALSSLGSLEIISGLSAGDIVVLSD